MSIIIGQNSWVTVQEADAYLTNKLDSQSWFLLPETGEAGKPSKELFLVMAFHTLVNKPGYELPPVLPDLNVKFAQSELAYYFIDNYASFLQQGNSLAKGVKAFTLSKWSETYASDFSWRGDFPLPVMVTKWIDAYSRNNMTVSLERD